MYQLFKYVDKYVKYVYIEGEDIMVSLNMLQVYYSNKCIYEYVGVFEGLKEIEDIILEDDILDGYYKKDYDIFVKSYVG